MVNSRVATTARGLAAGVCLGIASIAPAATCGADPPAPAGGRYGDPAAAAKYRLAGTLREYPLSLQLIRDHFGMPA